MDNQKKKLSLEMYLNLCLAVVIVAAGFYFIHKVTDQSRKQALAEAETKAQLILDRNLAIHTYFSHSLKPAVFELTDSMLSETYFEPAWMSSTFAVREIDKNFKKLNDEHYYYKECAINARSPENEADEFEKKFIEELNAKPELKYSSSIRQIDSQIYYVTLRRGEVMEEACLRCHSTPDMAPKKMVDMYGPERSFNRSVDETVSAISIRVPLSAAYANADRFSTYLSTILAVVLLLIFAVQYLLHRLLILDPIKRIKDQALSISKNEDMLGKEIALPFSREFDELATAFNAMSHHLRYQLDNLENTVERRTSELKQTNENLQLALDEIKTLSGILPICMHCKEIRDDKGYWTKLEKYISEHSDAEFSQSICDKCLDKYYPDKPDS